MGRRTRRMRRTRRGRRMRRTRRGRRKYSAAIQGHSLSARALQFSLRQDAVGRQPFFVEQAVVEPGDE